MPFWLLVLILVALIALCWGGSWGMWYNWPAGGPVWPGLLFVLGLVFFIVLVIMFVGGGVATDVRTH